MKIAVLLPVYNPDEKFLQLVEDLSKRGFKVVACNDGSKESCDEYFRRAKPFADVIGYKDNKGKGYALKRGFEYIGNNLADEVDYIVTADSDGQHAIEDIERVAKLTRKTDGIVLGMRDLSERIPIKSRIGNDMSKFVYTIVTGVYLRDNQSGLRGFPVRLCQWLQDIPGNKYEYELNVLVTAHKEGMKVTGIDIKTIYENNNKNTHFKPIKDTFRIQRSLWSYGLISMLMYSIYIVTISVLVWFRIPYFFFWLVGIYVWVTAMHAVINVFSAGIRHRQKISVIYYVTCSIKYCISTLIMLLFFYQGWNMILSGLLCWFAIIMLSYLFGRSGILGKV
ncbi:MAG: glycosyltransferase [Clostridiales bacterium]|jgi:glycosyltransferase involved in cell wall biosynthesis|nr:glycosyltransferase [Clostridiales bacterium]